MEPEKNNSTSIFIAIILIILILSVAMIYTLSDNENNIQETEEVILENITKRDGIKKSSLANASSSEDTNIDTQIYDSRIVELVNIFNNSNFAEKMRSLGKNLNVDVKAVSNFSGMKLLIYSDYGYILEIVFTLDNNVLSTVIPYNENDKDKFVVEAIASQVLIDCAGQRKGYAENEVGKAMGSDEVQYYTIENEGIEFGLIPDTYDISVKIDLDSNFPFMNEN